jgi:hypothetical protein
VVFTGIGGSSGRVRLLESSSGKKTVVSYYVISQWIFFGTTGKIQSYWATGDLERL